MHKLLIVFKGNHYSIVKDAFKALFKGVFRWNGAENGWFGKGGYVKATAKMETGAPVTFEVECNDEMLDKFIGHDEKQNDKIVHIPGFCDTNKIEFQKVESFDIAKPEPAPIQKPIFVQRPEPHRFKLNRATAFLEEMAARGGKFSDAFVNRWYQLLVADDDRLNAMLDNSQD